MAAAQEQHPGLGGNCPHCLVVLVLYNMHPEESPAFCSLQGIRNQSPDIGDFFDLLLWDNSATSHNEPSGFFGTFLRDLANPGLAAAYNTGLRQASQRKMPWLVLLDQDTCLTQKYMRELMQTVQSVSPEVSVLLPRLLHNSHAVSPSIFKPLGPSRSYAGPSGLVEAGTIVQGFNSGAVLRVSAMEKLGGFDARFPLDYLDHATFAALQQAGGRVFLLNATLTHSLSTNTGKRSTALERQRQKSILSARRRFLSIYGTRWERWSLPLKTLREAASFLFRKLDVPGAAQMLRHLFLRRS